MKKLFAYLSLIFLSIFILNSSVFAYTDVGSNNKYYDAIQFITTNNIVQGYSDGSFRPASEINRAEMLKILIEPLAGPDNDPDFDSFSDDECFTDVPKNEWYTKYVCYAKNENIVTGYSDGTFRPADTITLVEALKLILEFYNISYSSSSPWYKDIVDTASEKYLIPIDFVSFDQKVTRGQMAELITRMIKYGIGDLNAYLGDKKNYNVTYNTLLNNTNVEIVCQAANVCEGTGGQNTGTPSSVANLKAVALDGAVKLTWDSATDDVAVTGYKVFYGTSTVQTANDNYDNSLDVGNVLQYTVGGLNNGTTYYFSAIAYDADFNESMYWALEQSAKPNTGEETLLSKVCGDAAPNSSGSVTCSTTKQAEYGCGWAAEVSYFEYDFVTCHMGSVSSDEVLVYSGGMMSSGYNLLTLDEDGKLVEIDNVPALVNFWGEMVNTSSAKGYVLALTGHKDLYSLDELTDLYGDDFELSVDEEDIKYSFVSFSGGEYHVPVYAKATFGCSPFPVYEKTYTVGTNGDYEVTATVKIGEVDNGLCVD